jgi:hypothetical protein
MQATSIRQGIYGVSQKSLGPRGNAFKVEWISHSCDTRYIYIEVVNKPVALASVNVLALAFNTAKTQSISFGENEV